MKNNLGAPNNYFEDLEYMSEPMINYFKDILHEMHYKFLKKEQEISLSLLDAPLRMPDAIEEGTNQEMRNENFMFQEHEDYLRHEVELAIKRIEEGTYGYCEETGDPIGFKRLLAVPYARYCVKIQGCKEQERILRTR